MITIGTKVLFRNGETCVIKQINEYKGGYTTCGINMSPTHVKSYTTYVLKFADNEITLANKKEFKVIE